MQSRKFVYVGGPGRRGGGRVDRVAANRVYNLANDETVTIKQIAETVQELMGDVEIVYTPARPGDFGGKIVSADRATESWGGRHAPPFSKGSPKYIDWRLETTAGHGEADQDAALVA